MTEMELLLDFHKDAERQGPGSPAETRKALNLLGIGKDAKLNIADIGCGSGAQTITVAENTNASITAIDLFPVFLKKLEETAEALHLGDRIRTEQHSMEELPYADETFDGIWSEGAIYNMGFENGVKAWSRLLRPNGFLAVSEISWLSGSRPKELEEHWLREYPQIDTVSNNVKILEESGYSSVAFFVLPEYCWMDNYYRPMQERMPKFLEKHHHSKEAQELVACEQEEIRIYETYKDYYGYGFYLARKR